ncbi:hypothetical protein ElyMa_004971500 [Elysia marginata]|uniref:Uncharacterized protein n=1 Tax=Elysia marginata TaxID=1093978 RepID=A0AAV4J5W1_9GAST|nr:hypothetical protein ElyMa_004971500 [Elysia marginata]
MSMLTIESSVLRRRKVVDCTPRSLSSVFWQVNASMPSASTYGLSQKTPAIPKVSRDHLLPTSFLYSCGKVQNSPTSQYDVAFDCSTTSISSVRPLLPCVRSYKPRQASGVNEFDQNQSGNFTQDSTTRVSLGVNRRLNVQGHGISQGINETNDNPNWNFSIDAIQCFNDPWRVKHTRYVRDGYLLSSCRSVNAPHKPTPFPQLGREKQSASKNAKRGCAKVTSPYGCEVDACVLSPTVHRFAKNVGLGRTLLNAEISEENDRVLIKEIRQMLQDPCVTTSPETEKPYSKLQTGLINSSGPQCYALTTENEGQLDLEKVFCTRPHKADEKVKFEMTTQQSEEHLTESSELKESIYSSEEKASFVNRCTAFNVKKETVLDRTDTLDYHFPLLNKSKGDMIESGKGSKLSLVGQQKVVSFADGSSDLTLSRGPNYSNCPHDSSINKTHLVATNQKAQKLKNQGLELIDKIKNTQEWLTRVRVKTPFVSWSNSQENEDARYQQKQVFNTPAGRSPERNTTKQIPRVHKPRLGMRKPFTRSAVINGQGKQPPASVEVNAEGSGDFFVKPPPPPPPQSVNHFMSQTHLKEDLIASSLTFFVEGASLLVILKSSKYKVVVEVEVVVVVVVAAAAVLLLVVVVVVVVVVVLVVVVVVVVVVAVAVVVVN